MNDSVAIAAFIFLMVIAMQFYRRRSGRPITGGTMATFVSVATADELDSLFSQSQTGPVVLYLHDPYCPVSARAFDQVDRTAGEIHIVDVSRQRDLSQAIQQRTGIRHESPQAFILRNGAQIWNASHGAITTSAIEAARGVISSED